MLDEALVANPPKDLPKLAGTIQASGMTWADEDGMRVIDNVSFSIEAAQTVSITTTSGTAKDVLAQLLGRIMLPTNGSLVLGGAQRVHPASGGRWRANWLCLGRGFFLCRIDCGEFNGGSEQTAAPGRAGQ
jgi:ABC-type glutathione transport system ATPase component